MVDQPQSSTEPERIITDPNHLIGDVSDPDRARQSKLRSLQAEEEELQSAREQLSEQVRTHGIDAVPGFDQKQDELTIAQIAVMAERQLLEQQDKNELLDRPIDPV